ncbi:Protein vip1 [Elasticomyces elasticus]|nr:Protein vip1 [Elasticomyces elasticus]
MSNTVHVKNISSQTSEKEVRDFFSFCGKISSLSVTRTSDSADSTQSATVTFEKETAAKTALLLDSTQLGPAQVHVSSAASLDQMSGGKSAGSADEHGEDIAQEDKPRSRIVAEYLAHGYVISDKAIERAIALDNQHGISNRFMNALTNFDSKFKATEKAQAVDQKYGVTDKAYSGWRGLNSYFDKAMGTPTGQKVRQFYSVGNKQVVDVHNEARHLANLKSGKNETTPVGDGKTKCVLAQAVPRTLSLEAKSTQSLPAWNKLMLKVTRGAIVEAILASAHVRRASVLVLAALRTLLKRSDVLRYLSLTALGAYDTIA